MELGGAFLRPLKVLLSSRRGSSRKHLGFSRLGAAQSSDPCFLPVSQPLPGWCLPGARLGARHGAGCMALPQPGRAPFPYQSVPGDAPFSSLPLNLLTFIFLTLPEGRPGAQRFAWDAEDWGPFSFLSWTEQASREATLRCGEGGGRLPRRLGD